MERRGGGGEEMRRGSGNQEGDGKEERAPFPNLQGLMYRRVRKLPMLKDSI